MNLTWANFLGDYSFDHVKRCEEVNSLVIELQRDALDSGVRTADLVRKALTVASKLQVADFDSWAKLELGGYPTGVTIPPYRVAVGQLKAHHPLRGWLPIILNDHEAAEKIATSYNNQGVAELEYLLTNSGDQGVLQVPLSKELEARLMAMLSAPVVPVVIVPSSAIVNILDSVRTTVLNWSLQLERDGIVGDGMSFSHSERQIAATHVYNVTNYFGSVAGSQIQQFSNDSQQGSISSET